MMTRDDWRRKHARVVHKPQTEGAMETTMTETTMDGTGIETPPMAPERTYSDMVIDSLTSARESVERAIAHYEQQRAEAVASHEQRIAEVDSHIARLRGVLAPVNGHVATPIAVKTTADRVAAHLLTRTGPVLLADVAKTLGLVNSAVNSECRRCKDRFTVLRNSGRVYVELK